MARSRSLTELMEQNRSSVRTGSRVSSLPPLPTLSVAPGLEQVSTSVDSTLASEAGPASKVSTTFDEPVNPNAALITGDVWKMVAKKSPA